jgi:hypothetical protein
MTREPNLEQIVEFELLNVGESYARWLDFTLASLKLHTLKIIGILFVALVADAIFHIHLVKGKTWRNLGVLFTSKFWGLYLPVLGKELLLYFTVVLSTIMIAIPIIAVVSPVWNVEYGVNTVNTMALANLTLTIILGHAGLLPDLLGSGKGKNLREPTAKGRPSEDGEETHGEIFTWFSLFPLQRWFARGAFDFSINPEVAMAAQQTIAKTGFGAWAWYGLSWLPGLFTVGSIVAAPVLWATALAPEGWTGTLAYLGCAVLPIWTVINIILHFVKGEMPSVEEEESAE